jgi:hypothetical protein
MSKTSNKQKLETLEMWIRSNKFTKHSKPAKKQNTWKKTSGYED